MDDRDGLWLCLAVAALAAGHILLGRIVQHNQKRLDEAEIRIAYLREHMEASQS